ncbi:MAG: hypothetical protein GX657_09350 [Chloroflexi bacterium]|nr:hypothetical protein [Chloroflexota bacterium]
MAIWNGYSWLHLDARLPGIPASNAMRFVGDSLYIGFTTAGTALASGYTTVTNPGNARVHPVVTVTATGGQVTLQSLANETTGQRILFDLTVLAGETITIDTRPGSAGLRSDYRGTALGANPLAGSQLASFVLDPGENVLSLFADETPGGTATAQVRFRPAYWSTD